MPLIVCSPSNLAQFQTCPLKFYGQRSKMMPWKETPQKKRGTEVHATLEKALNEGVQAVPVWPDGIKEMYTLTVLQRLKAIKDAGATLYTEHEMCVTPEFKATDWWDEFALLRAKADLLLVVPGVSALLGDWKTGRIYEGMDFQLRTEALLVHVLYGVPVVNWSLFYVDQGQTKSGSVDFSKGIAPVQDVLDLIRVVQKTVGMGGPFYPKKNKFCKWCDWYHTEYCEESKKW